MGWLIALGVLTLLAFIPIGISASYDSRGARVFFKVGPFRFRITLNNKDKDKKDTTPPEKQTDSKDTKSDTSDTEGFFEAVRPLLCATKDFLIGLKRRIYVKRIELKAVLADDDPADLAINYGRAWAALGNLMPHLEHFFLIKKRDLEVECDFTSEKTVIFARIEIRIILIRAITLIVRYGMRLIREYYKFKNK